ncbi:MAG TPA: hypothetical protein VGN49_10730, partial [Micrococcaceae bacterium]|nr:hypothetical protein [Micrococcaceae bacterium]
CAQDGLRFALGLGRADCVLRGGLVCCHYLDSERWMDAALYCEVAQVTVAVIAGKVQGRGF